MRIISWNVNGIRAVYNKGFLDWFYNESPDILCIQETKASDGDLVDELRNPKGYFSYFHSSTVKKGYSGVGIYSKTEPIEVEHGMGVKTFDGEGRVLIAHYRDFVLFNVYFPNTGRDERVKYKLEFNDALLNFLNKYKNNKQKVVLCGDFNVAHEEIDLARPKENEGFPGFRPEERAWMDELESAGYIDSFRYFYPEKKNAYTWWDMKSRARDRNVGWRIDYFFVSQNSSKNLKKAFILDHVMGSDHCPLGVELEFN